MKSYGPRVEFAAKRKNRFVKKMRIIREKIRDLKKSKIFAKNHQNKQNTASTPMVFAKIFARNFAKKFAKHKRKFSHFLAKLFVRCKSLSRVCIEL